MKEEVILHRRESQHQMIVPSKAATKLFSLVCWNILTVFYLIHELWGCQRAALWCHMVSVKKCCLQEIRHTSVSHFTVCVWEAVGSGFSHWRYWEFKCFPNITFNVMNNYSAYEKWTVYIHMSLWNTDLDSILVIRWWSKSIYHFIQHISKYICESQFHHMSSNIWIRKADMS